MKNRFCLFFLLFFFQSGWSQSTMEHQNELGFNANVLLNQIFYNNQPPQVGFPIVVPPDQFTTLTYRRYSTPTLAFRSGFGFFQDEARDSTSSGFFFSTDLRKLKYWGFNIGLQRRLNISKILKPYIGMDIIYQNYTNTFEHYEVSTGGFDWEYESREITKENRIGVGVPIGIQIFFTKNISISTESNLEFIYSKSESEFRTLVGQQGINENEFKNTIVEWKLPLSIFVNYSF